MATLQENSSMAILAFQGPLKCVGEPRVFPTSMIITRTILNPITCQKIVLQSIDPGPSPNWRPPCDSKKWANQGDWDKHRDQITTYYQEMKYTLATIMNLMENGYGFYAT
jgi:hypothetical protein